MPLRKNFPSVIMDITKCGLQSAQERTEILFSDLSLGAFHWLSLDFPLMVMASLSQNMQFQSLVVTEIILSYHRGMQSKMIC